MMNDVQTNKGNESRKLLVDLSTFKKEHKGGKDEVAYNLLRGFSCLGYVPQIVCVAKRELVDIVHKIDPAYTVIPLERRHYKGRIGNLFSPVTDFIYGNRLRKIVKEHNCDRVLYTNKLSPFVKQPVKTYLIPHDIQFFKVLKETNKLKLYTRVYCFYIKICFHVCDRIIAISDYDKNEMIQYMPQNKEKIIRIYDPIRFRSVKPASQRPYITALNIQHHHKNTITLVKAYANLARDISENLILIGRRDFLPEVEEEINRIIRDNHLEERIIFAGFVNDDEMNDIISKTRIFVNPSLFEGFGMAAVEMMESKVPTIVADNSAQSETTLGLCRYYKPATDDAALSEMIQTELRHPTTDQELDSIANRIRQQFDYIQIAKEYWNEMMMKEG